MTDHEPNQQVAQSSRAARRVGLNAAALLAGDVLNRGTTFAIYALVARYCGAHPFGQLSLGLILLYAFQVLASVGLPTLIFRDVSKLPKSDAKYLVNACAVAGVAFVICYSLLVLFALASGYAADTTQVILILGLSILPWSLSLITEAIIRAHERMHLTLWAAIPVSCAKLALAFYLLSQGFGVVTIAIVLFAAHTAMFVIQWGLMLGTLQSKLSGCDVRFCKEMLNSTRMFFGIDALVAIWASVNVVLLSWFSGEIAVGVFGAAVQLLVPPGIALQAVVTSLFPVMCRRADQERAGSRQLSLMMFEILTFIAVPGCVLLWFCAEPLIALIYHSDGFVESAMIVRVIVPSLVLSALTRLLGQVLMSHRREHVNLRIVAVDVVFNVVCGTVLIYAFGVMGAAVTLLLTHSIDCWLHYMMSRDLLADDMEAPASGKFVIFWHTLASTVAMAAVLGTLPDVHVIWSVVAGSLTFVMTFALLCCLSRGGVVAFHERFLTPLSETTP